MVRRMNSLAMHPIKMPVPTPPLPTYHQATARIPLARATPLQDTYERPQAVPEPLPPKRRKAARAVVACGVLTAATACLVGLGVAFSKQWRQLVGLGGSA